MNIYGDKSLCNLPRSEEKIELFKLWNSATSKEVQDEYVKRGLAPAHIDDVIAYIKSHPDAPTFVATQWDNEGCCYAACYRWRDGRGVSVSRDDGDWRGECSFAGVPQESSKLDTYGKTSETLPSELIINNVKYKRV